MKKFNVEKFVGIAMLAAIVVVLQFFANNISFGGVSITLVLLPIVVGASLYGVRAGALLGAIFGCVVVAGILIFGPRDPLTSLLWSSKPIATSLVCIIKGSVAGFLSGIVFKLLLRNNTSVNRAVSSYLAAITCPVVNTGIFLLAMFTIFKTQLIELAGGTNTYYFAFVVIAGVNFLIELAVNIILAPVIVRLAEFKKVKNK